VQRCGLILPSAIDVKDEGPTARYLIESLLKAEPSEYVHTYMLCLCCVQLDCSSHESVLTLPPLPCVTDIRRIGVQEGDTGAILDHEFFSGVDLANMRNRRYVPNFIPNTIPGDENLSNLPAAKPYAGDQSPFSGF